MCCWELIILEWGVIAELKRKTFWLLHCLFLLFNCYIVWVSLCICCLHSLFEDFSLWGFCFHLRAGLVCCCFLPIVLASDSCLQKENLDPSCLQVFCNSVMMQPYCAPYPWTHEELHFTIFSKELEPLLLHWFHPQPIWEWRILSTWISIATTLVTYLKRSANTKVENGNDIFSISSGMWMVIHKLQFACQLDSNGPHSSKWRNTLDVFCGLMNLCARSTEIAACCQGATWLLMPNCLRLNICTYMFPKCWNYICTDSACFYLLEMVSDCNCCNVEKNIKICTQHPSIRNCSFF